MAQRRSLESAAITAHLIRCRPQPKEPRTVPSCAGNFRGDLGEAGKSLAVMGKAIGHHHDPIALALPCPHQFGSRLDPPGQYALMDGDPSRSAAFVEADLLLKQFTQDGFLALGALGPAFRIPAFPRLELMGAWRFSVSDVAIVCGGPSTSLGRRLAFSRFGHFALPRFAEERAAATSSKVCPVAFRIASRLVKSCQRRMAAST